MKRISIILTAILCALSCAACGAPKTDSSSVLQDSAAPQPDSISTKQESAADENITESLETANLCAKAVFTDTVADRTLEKAVSQN